MGGRKGMVGVMTEMWELGKHDTKMSKIKMGGGMKFRETYIGWWTPSLQHQLRTSEVGERV